MRYIRIKHAVFEADKNNIVHYHGCRFEIPENQILKTSNNLLDLLDGFIVTNDRDQNLWIFLEVKEYLYDKENDILLDTWDYKGFIKTDKGLIYVAQQNRNTGELELL